MFNPKGNPVAKQGRKGQILTLILGGQTTMWANKCVAIVISSLALLVGSLEATPFEHCAHRIELAAKRSV